MSVTKKIDSRSGSAYPIGLELFSVRPSQTAVLKSQFKEYLPLSNESPWEWRIFSDNNYLDVSKVYLYLKAGIEKFQDNAWVPIENDDHAAPVNSFGTAFVKQLRCTIAGNEVYDSSSNYGYLTYIKGELNNTREYKHVIGPTFGYYAEGLAPNAEDDPSHVLRLAMANAGRNFETYTKLDFDLSNQDQYLLPNLDIVFTLYQADNAFLIKSYEADDPNVYRIRVHSIKLYIKTVEVQPSVNVAVARMLERENANYSMRRLQIRTIFMAAGRTQITENVFSSILPRRLIVAMVSNQSYIGNIAQTPWNFQHYNLREICVNAAGTTVPLIPWNCNFTNEQDMSVVRIFTQMHESCSYGQTPNGITMAKFLNGSAFFVLPLNATMEDSNSFDLIRDGTTSLSLQFNEPLPEAATLIVLGEFDSLLQITKDRLIVTDGSV